MPRPMAGRKRAGEACLAPTVGKEGPVPQLALVIPGKILLVWACCLGVPVLAVVILTVLVGILKRGKKCP